MVEHIKYDLFPTAIVRSKCPSITPQDKKEMMDCTDWMIEQGMYTDNDLTPKYQTHVILFRDDAPAIWLKLREEFYQACRTYLKTVDSFVQNQDAFLSAHYQSTYLSLLAQMYIQVHKNSKEYNQHLTKEQYHTSLLQITD